MRILLLCLLSVLAAGCLGGPDVVISAKSPVLLQGYAYDGRDATQGEGTLELALDDGADTGTIVATAKDLFHTYEVRWANFSGRQAYQGGGVVRDVDLWGSSGNGSAAFPRVHAYVAVFGAARATVDGAPDRDPSSLDATMSAVLFVSRGQYRDAQTHRVTQADQVGAYDPGNPQDAFVNQIGAQATLLLFTDRGELYRHLLYEDVQVRKS